MKRLSTSLLIFILALLAVPERMWAENVSVKFLVRVADSDVAPALYLWNSNSNEPLNGAWADTQATDETETINEKTYYKYTVNVPTATDLKLITKKSGDVNGDGNQSDDSNAFQIGSGVSVDYVLVDGSFSKSTKPEIQVVNKSSETGNTFYLGCAKNNWGKDEGYKFTSESSSGSYTYTLAKENVSAITDGYFYVSILPYYNGTQWSNGGVERICPTNGDGTELTSSASNSNAQVSTTFTSWKVKYEENATDYVFTFNHSNMSFSVVPTLVSETIDPQLGTSSNGKAYYLATEENGEYSIFGTDATMTTTGNTVTYSRILRFNDKGDGSYELNIPATISGNVWILEIDKQNKETTYRPVETVAVGSSNPANNSSINGSFGGSGTSTVFTLTDRGDVDGIYKIKLNLNTSGIPAKWTITHDPLTRVAYYLSTARMSSASPVYDQRANTTDAFSNRFIGTNYFNEDSNVDYYVISNILKGNDNNYVNSAHNFDTSVAANSNWNVITTVNKLLLLGNGGLAFSDQKPNNEFSPNELPMKSSDLLKGLCAVQYNPSNGDNDKAVETTHYGIRGQIIVRQGSSSTETTSMKIFGPLVAASVKSDGKWDPAYSKEEETLTDGISSNNVMKYDEKENCYTITIVTNNEQQGKHFRFIRNENLKYTWTEDATKARIPYYDNSVTGSSAATVADPNYVNYEGSDTDRNIDILFNRPAGKWTIKFYIVNEASSSDGSVKSKYYYTINAEDNFEVVIPSALNKVLRTYSYGSDVKPQDANVHVYVAHSFGPATGNDQYTDTKTGTVHLYEINYVPANTGVVLYCGEGTDAKTVTFVEANEYNVTNYAASKTDKKKLWKNSHEGDFNNDLEPVLARTFVDNSVKDESGDIIARNFCMSLFSKTKAAQGLLENSYDDYIGFFRVKSYISANKAYLQYGKDIINENAQIFGQDTVGEAVSGGAKLAMVFEGFEDDNVVTGISDNLSAKPVLTDDSYYNLQGMRVEKPVKGIYIHNGKKVVIK